MSELSKEEIIAGRRKRRGKNFGILNTKGLSRYVYGTGGFINLYLAEHFTAYGYKEWFYYHEGGRMINGKIEWASYEAKLYNKLRNSPFAQGFESV